MLNRPRPITRASTVPTTKQATATPQMNHPGARSARARTPAEATADHQDRPAPSVGAASAASGAAPGHADGHVALLRDGVLVSGDVVLGEISPAVGLYPESRPDPLADYLRSLQRIVELDPDVVYGGHGEPVRAPAGRARGLVAHHLQRLEGTPAAPGPQPPSGYEVSLRLFGEELSPPQRRFAVAETLSHLEHLVARGQAARGFADGTLAYTGT